MRVVFRADASLAIGTGHVMRCIALASALRDAGHDCTFISRDLPGNLIARTQGLGFATHALPAPDGATVAPGPDHAAWAGVAWQTDAAQTASHLSPGTDWLVLDHYAFDARWTAAARPPGARVMVIDDLADRPQYCDLLLDQTLGRRAADYDGLVPPGAERLIGPAFATLRPEFAAQRQAALAGRRVRGHALRHVFIFMGGADLPNATGQILHHLGAALRSAPHGIDRITVVMGPTAPAMAAVRAQAADMPVPCAVLSDVPDMAALMAQADLAIGAGGGTSWERCALGLPTLLVVLADNQAAGAAALGGVGAAVVLGTLDDPALPARLSEQLTRLADPSALRAMAGSAAAVTDGRGLSRIVAALQTPFHLRPATPQDAPAVWHWRESLPPAAFLGGSNPPLDHHLAWFKTACATPGRHLLMAQGETAFGHLRIEDGPDQGQAIVSIVLAPESRARGLGLRMLAQTADWARLRGLSVLIAHIHPDNAASLALFGAAGYRASGATTGFQIFRKGL